MLIEIAAAKGQGHLLAMAERRALPTGLTDVMVRARRSRGGAPDRRKRRRELLAIGGYATLIKRANQDGVLTLTVGQRDDLSG